MATATQPQSSRSVDALHNPVGPAVGDGHGRDPVPVVHSESPPAAPRSLDELARLSPAALHALYVAAQTPALRAVDGDLVGRMLAVPVLPRFLAGVLRRFAAWARFPWRGKSFSSLDDVRGQGINRVFGDRNPRRWFRFDTFIAPSRAGAFDAFQLDYDNPGNPKLIRAIKDEIREVAPGLFLGLAYLVWRERPRLMVYFGLARR